MSMLPPWLQAVDPEWGKFSDRELRDILVLRDHARTWRSDDRDFAGVPLVQDDWTARVVILTVCEHGQEAPHDRTCGGMVEVHAHRYWARRSSEAFVLTNDWVQGS